MRGGVLWIIAAALALLILGGLAAIRLALSADPARRARGRETAAVVVQYGLLFGFAAVAAAISAHGLVGFARANMGLPGLWPYLLWGALDGAAGLCAVILMRRAARGEPALAPRLAVWGLVAASSLFNWTHAPDHPGAREAFALMPVIAATLFEFSLRETRQTAQGTERRLAGLGWLRPGERVRVRLALSADGQLSADAATRRVRIECAARRLHVLRQALAARERAARPVGIAAHRARRAERRAQAAMSRARFADPSVAAEVLRQVQVLTLTRTLARLDYATPDPAHAVLASLIVPAPGNASLAGEQASRAVRACRLGSVTGTITLNGHPAVASLNGASATPAARAAHHGLADQALLGNRRAEPPAASRTPCPQAPPRRPGNRDSSLIEVAAGIVEEAGITGSRLSQAALARQLRAKGYSIANDRLRWLTAVSGLDHHAEPT